jgi:hypothetical protein
MNIVEETSSELADNHQSKKKKVRWADIEENALHLHKRAGNDERKGDNERRRVIVLVGFVVGQTEEDWQRMSDAYDPSQKLNQYRYI